MSEQAQAETCKPVKTLIDASVEVDLYVPAYRQSQYGVEEHAKALEKAASEFMEFVRDHRHQDTITGIQVVRKYADLCSHCKQEWELMPADEDGPDACAYCGTPLEANLEGGAA